MLVKPNSNRKSVKYKNNEIKGAQQGKIKSEVDYKHGKPRYILRTWMKNAKRQNEETTLLEEQNPVKATSKEVLENIYTGILVYKWLNLSQFWTSELLFI